jgi:hypothetical protein
MEIKKVIELAKELNLDYEVYEKDYYFYLPKDWVYNGEDYMVEEEDDREAFFVWRHNNKHAVATLNIVIDADLNFYYNDSEEYNKFTELETRIRKFYSIFSQLQEIRKKMEVQKNIEKIKSDFN